MRLVEIVLVERVNGVFYLNGYSIPSTRQASDGYGVLLVFEPTRLDKDFEVALGPGKLCFFIKAAHLEAIRRNLDLSDYLTRDHLRNGKGWSGERPLADLM